MSTETLLKAAVGALLALNAATFKYVIDIEHRLTRLEAIDEARKR